MVAVPCLAAKVQPRNYASQGQAYEWEVGSCGPPWGLCLGGATGKMVRNAIANRRLFKAPI